jgi:rod shape determining protein RodA
MTPLFKKLLGLNWILLAVMGVLLMGGALIIYHATHFRADDPGIAMIWRRHIQWGLIGLAAFFAAALIDYQWIRWGALPAYLAGIGGLVAVQVAGQVKGGTKMGDKMVGGNKSWLELPGNLSVQPSQFAIAAGIIALAFVLGELHRRYKWFRYHFVRLMVAGVVTMVPLGFVLKEGDLGSALVWVPVFGAMLLAGSIPFRYLIAMGLVGALALPWLFFFGLKDYQRDRILVPLKMIQGKPVNYQDEGYASINNVRAIGSAGWEGKGADGSRMPTDPTTGNRRKTIHQLGYIPKDTAHNDYIFTVFAEQQGFRGSLVLIGLFALLVFQCLFIAFCARDQTGRLLVVGVAALLFAHIFENIGMQVQLMPITGIPLPFVSYGGTFLITVMFLLGMVQSVWVHRHEVLEEERDRDKERRPRRPLAPPSTPQPI